MNLKAYDGKETVTISSEDIKRAEELVDEARNIQEDCTAAEDEDEKAKVVAARHATERTLDEGCFCKEDVKTWKKRVRDGLVFALCQVALLWLAGTLTMDHVKTASLFPVSMPYHATHKTKDSRNVGYRFEVYLQAFFVLRKEKFLAAAEAAYNNMPKSKKKTKKAKWDTIRPMFELFLEGEFMVYVGRSVKGGFWRYFNTNASAVEAKGSGYAKQTVVGILQALANEGIVEYKGVVLWRAKEDEVVGYFDQLWLELLFGSMVFTPKRTSSRPPETDKVLNWARLGLYMAAKEPHVLSEEEAEERRLEKNEYQRLYAAKPVNKERKRLYCAKPAAKERKRFLEAKPAAKAKRQKSDQQRNQQEGCLEAMRMLANGPR